MKKILLFTFILICVSVMTISSAPIYSRTGEKAKGTVLMYHLISKDSNMWSDYCVSPDTLEKDIKLMLSKGFIFIKANDIFTLANNKEKYVMLTFDDGYESDYNYVYPLLLRYKVPATFFITGIYINRPEYLKSSQITEMAKSEFVEFGNHSYQLHEKTTKELKECYSDRKNLISILMDYEKTDKLIESLTGKNAVALSYPYGVYTNVLETYIKAKFNRIITFSTNYGNVRLPYSGKPINRINRANVYNINLVNQ